MFTESRKKIRFLTVVVAIVCIFVAGIFYLINENYSLAQTSSSTDAIAIRILANPDHLSAFDWYKKQGFKGAPQSLTVDGYEAVRDGRTVYVNVANIITGATSNRLYTNIYLISYNQQAEKVTLDIFSQILSFWKFNTNITGAGHCRNNSVTACTKDDECALGDFCDSLKARTIRDVKRLSDITYMKDAMTDYQKKKGFYPKLDAGTYLPHRSISVWPSWKDTLSKEMGISLPNDPVNKIGDCPGYNEVTCWNEETKRFVTTLPDLPNSSLLYSYASQSSGGAYDICAVFESGADLGTGVCAISMCLDFDGDGYGNPASTRCTYSAKDCNDTDSTVGAGTSEAANCNNGIDDDCDGFIDCYDSECSSASHCTGIVSCDFGGPGDCEPGEDCNSCPSDCGACPITCGDGFCDETCNECNSCYDLTGTITSHDPSLDCYCGDGTICTSRGEECDDGVNNGAPTSSCTTNCRLKVCRDADHDGYSAEGGGNCCGLANNEVCNADIDCNDSDPTINPGEPEVCDGRDNDCRNGIDNGFLIEDCPWVCAAAAYHWTGNATVLLPNLNCCGNNANEAGPYEDPEISCSDGRDNDCNGLIDGADASCSGGCNNLTENDHVNMATPGNCNQCTVNGDQDGDQTMDNPTLDWLPVGNLGIADQCDSDCNISIATTVTRTQYHNTEIGYCSDGIDNDCDGVYDCNDHADCDSDAACCTNECAAVGTGCVSTTTRWECGNFDVDPCLDRRETSCGALECVAGSCVAPCHDEDHDMYSAEGGGNCCGLANNLACNAGIDCNDSNQYVNPGRLETCDGYNNNCDGTTDEGCDDDGDGYCDGGMPYFNNFTFFPFLTNNPCPNTTASSSLDCNDIPPGGASIHPGATENCDGIDNDCDGTIDEGYGREDCQATCTAGASGFTWLGLGGVRNCCGNDSGTPYFEANPYATTEAGRCGDTRDNDCDGDIDCADISDCASDPLCSPCTFTFTLPCSFP